MSSTVCQGLQSCLEPLFVEPCISRLKLAPSKPKFSEKPITNDDLGGLGSIQALTNPTQFPKDVIHDENVYVHPLTKLSSSRLSPKSLEMCTESLGSETGESGDDFTWESIQFNAKERRHKMQEKMVKKKMQRSNSFPPPLTSISGSDNVQVRPHREGGRLVMKAVTVACQRTCFEVERGGGRLRLRLSNSYYDNYNNLDDEGEDDIENIEQVNENVEVEHDNDDGNDNDELLDDEEDMEGNNGNGGGEIGIGKFPRPSRCKEGGRGREGVLWETFLVATS